MVSLLPLSGVAAVRLRMVALDLFVTLQAMQQRLDDAAQELEAADAIPLFHRSNPQNSTLAGYDGSVGNAVPAVAQKLPAGGEAAIIDQMGERVAEWLRAAFPRNTAKSVARELGISHHTARRVLEGKLPENRLLVVMCARWGKKFVAHILEPAVGPWSAYAIEQEIQSLRHQLAVIASGISGESNSISGANPALVVRDELGV